MRHCAVLDFREPASFARLTRLGRGAVGAVKASSNTGLVLDVELGPGSNENFHSPDLALVNRFEQSCVSELWGRGR